MLTRRQALAVLASAATFPLVSACAGHRTMTTPAPRDAEALRLLDIVVGAPSTGPGDADVVQGWWSD